MKIIILLYLIAASGNVLGTVTDKCLDQKVIESRYDKLYEQLLKIEALIKTKQLELKVALENNLKVREANVQKDKEKEKENFNKEIDEGIKELNDKIRTNQIANLDLIKELEQKEINRKIAALKFNQLMDVRIQEKIEEIKLKQRKYSDTLVAPKHAP